MPKQNKININIYLDKNQSGNLTIWLSKKS